MAASLLSKVSIAVAACARRFTRHLLRARRLRRRGSCVCPGTGRRLAPADGGAAAGDGRDDALWRRAILMGQRCEPLDFPDAIHYDSFGRRVESPRCGSKKSAAAGALFCRSSDAVDEAVTAAKKASRAA